MRQNLRAYQTNALVKTRAQVRSGERRILVVSPTGSGKTTIASELIIGGVERGMRFWFVAHRRELIKQAFCRLVRSGIAPDQIGVLLGDTKHGGAPDLFGTGDLSDDQLFTQHARRRPRALIQVCSIDSLRARMNRDHAADTIADARRLEHPDVIIVDEAHRCLAASYLRLPELYPHSLIIGLTATPYRADRRGLGLVYRTMVVVAQPEELIALGHLVEPRVFTVPAEDLPQLQRVKIKGGDYDAKELSAAVDLEGLVGNVVEHWQRRAEGRRTVVFAVDVEHSKHLTARFVEAGVAAEHLDGETPTADRDAILARLGRGETSVVCNVGVLTEGWDSPSVKCCVLARPTKSLGLYLQMAGRILRPWERVEALILDHAGSAIEHGLPHADREFTLEDQPKRKKSANDCPVKTCPSCFCVLATGTTECPQCGHEFPPAAAMSKEESDGDLVEVRLATKDERRDRYAALLAEAKRTNRKPGWAFFRFKEEFHCEPPRDMKPPTEKRHGAPVEEMREWFVCAVRTQIERSYKPGWVTAQFKDRFGCMPNATWWLPTERMQHAAV